MRSFFRVLFSRGDRIHRISPNKHHRMASAGGATAALSMAAYYSSVTIRPPLATESHEFESKTHHVKDRHGKTVKFKNPYDSFAMPPRSDMFREIWKMWTGGWPQPKLEEKLVPVVAPQFLPTRTSSDKLRATWLGHACYYVEYPSGLRVLFDPVFEDCCAPFSFLGFKRYTEPPCRMADLPFVDAVVISHSHYDHLSYASVQEVQKHHPDAHFFVGLGLEKWFKQGGLHNVTELDWWQEADVTLTPGAAKAETDATSATSSELLPGQPITAKITCLPCQHGSGRTPWDRDQTLWASWAVASGSPARSVWFGGDTGYRSVASTPRDTKDDYGPEWEHLATCPQFRQIGERLGPFDLGLIPIGAYQPRRLFSGVHASPRDAVEIFRDTRCARAVGIHWGTWVMTPEPPLEPPRLLREALRRRGIAETGVFDVCDIGETREF
ncbi:Metallo-hydrolase/oxidoreductase [Hypoxylon rubiginosum]|uniref:Metallo-hydrolase/oxidoreductase n=1 Tax=Hypoxylon rubiginosum TaxID=110542 RepID=A0ACB9ZIZ6_9PEZI|nr:Metallo-hydrolase/oxidoreductase [Hypoxylon rubiginosum]